MTDIDLVLWAFLADDILREMMRPAPTPVFARETVAPARN